MGPEQAAFHQIYDDYVRREAHKVQRSTTDWTRRNIDSEVEKLDDLGELNSSQQEVQVQDQRVQSFEQKSARPRVSSPESTREMAAPAYNTEVLIIYEDREAPGEDNPEAEVTPRSQEKEAMGKERAGDPHHLPFHMATARCPKLPWQLSAEDPQGM